MVLSWVHFEAFETMAYRQLILLELKEGHARVWDRVLAGTTGASRTSQLELVNGIKVIVGNVKDNVHLEADVPAHGLVDVEDVLLAGIVVGVPLVNVGENLGENCLDIE